MYLSGHKIPECSGVGQYFPAGHAPPPNSLPAPRVTDMKSWFQTYGRPEPNAPPGVYSEFTSTAKSVPRGDGMATAQVKLYRGRVLR